VFDRVDLTERVVADSLGSDVIAHDIRTTMVEWLLPAERD
jgi:hypothetical protein